MLGSWSSFSSLFECSNLSESNVRLGLTLWTTSRHYSQQSRSHIVHSIWTHQLMSFPFLLHTIPVASALLIMQVFGTWVYWRITMNFFSILAISSYHLCGNTNTHSCLWKVQKELSLPPPKNPSLLSNVLGWGLYFKDQHTYQRFLSLKVGFSCQK
jgi:hypothetical protein